MAKARVDVEFERAVEELKRYGIRFEVRDGDIYFVGGDAVKAARLCREGKIKSKLICG